jgi:hypothetical protein
MGKMVGWGEMGFCCGAKTEFGKKTKDEAVKSLVF